MAGRAGHRGFGHLRKLPSGRVQASYVGPDTVRYLAPRTFDTQIDAEGWLVDERRRISAGTWLPPAERLAAPLTFREYVVTWLPNRRTRRGEKLKPRTVAHYSDLLENFLLPTFGDLPLQNVTPTIVRRWWAALGDDRPTYRAHAYGLLRAVMESARRDETLPVTVNPCAIEGAGRTDRKIRIDPASLDELATITNAMPERLRLMVLLAAWCQLRFGELAELRRKDVDLKRGRVRVARGVVRVSGKTIVGTPKTSAGKRDVTIPPHLLPLVEAHLRDHSEPGADGLLFPAERGGNLAPSSLYRAFYAARRAAGRDDLRWHDLRHSGAVLAAQAGATLAELMGRLGHSSPAAAMRYQHVARDRDKFIAARLSELAEGSWS